MFGAGKTNMIRIKTFRASVDSITISQEDFPIHCNKHCFHGLFPAFQYGIIDRIPELLSFVYMSHIKKKVFIFNLDIFFLLFFFFLFPHFPNPFMWNSIKYMEIN